MAPGASWAGQPATPVTDSSADQLSPAWSADGTALIYQSNGDGNWELYQTTLTDGRSVRLTDTPEAEEDPSWSPDGRWIVCTMHAPSLESDTPREILLMDREGKQRRVLAANGADDWYPRFDAAGRGIYFISDRVDNRPDVPDAQRNCALFRVDLSSGEVTQLTEAGRFTAPVPDGERVLLLTDPHEARWWSGAGLAPAWRDTTRYLGQPDWHAGVGFVAGCLRADAPANLLLRAPGEDGWRELALEGREADQTPAIRPDGAALAFAGKRAGQWDIWLRRAPDTPAKK